MMTGLLRALLGFVGAISMLGAVWFFGSADSYAGLLGGSAMLGWALLWSASGRTQFVSLTLLVLSIVATGWMAITRLTSNSDAAPVAFLFALIALVCAAVWLRQRTLL